MTEDKMCNRSNQEPQDQDKAGDHEECKSLLKLHLPCSAAVGEET